MVIIAPQIRQITIERFRSINSFSWCPSAGVNFILGGGDVGKTTILDAIALLLSPTNPSVVPDTDYYQRDDGAGFVIKAVLSLPDTVVSSLSRPLWPWDWNGTDAIVPKLDGDQAPNDPVFRLQVRGTADLELVYEIEQPDGSMDSLPVALRRQIGLIKLSGDDRNDRDLRFVQGSALDRLLSDKALRSRVGNELADVDIEERLSDEGKKALNDLDEAFRKKALPDGLDLAVTGSAGVSVMALVGLTADKEGVDLPLSSWGAGTRRLAALAIAEQNQNSFPIALVDEIERGLEPYRQRILVEQLQSSKSQIFVTTHSSTSLSAASKSALWYLDHAGKIGALDSSAVDRYRSRDPEVFLSKLSIACEGITEVGFVRALLQQALGTAQLSNYGLHLSDANGHEECLMLLESMSKGGLSFGGFADHEGKHPTRWASIISTGQGLIFQWKAGCLEENIIGLIPEAKFEELIKHPEKSGLRLRYLADRLEIQEKNFAAIQSRAGNNLRNLIIEAALGKVPSGKDDEKRTYKSHAQAFFKTDAGGNELFSKMFELGIWPSLKPQLLPFCNSIRKSLQLLEITDIGM